MRQLGQLQERYEAFKDADTEIVAVQREDKTGVKGLERIRKERGVELVLLTDYRNEATSMYSQGAFFTCIIDKQGVVRALLPVTVYDRPHGETILERTQEVVREESLRKPRVARF